MLQSILRAQHLHLLGVTFGRDTKVLFYRSQSMWMMCENVHTLRTGVLGMGSCCSLQLAFVYGEISMRGTDVWYIGGGNSMVDSSKHCLHFTFRCQGVLVCVQCW